jgi:hypothetical protein
MVTEKRKIRREKSAADIPNDRIISLRRTLTSTKLQFIMLFAFPCNTRQIEKCKSRQEKSTFLYSPFLSVFHDYNCQIVKSPLSFSTTLRLLTYHKMLLFDCSSIPFFHCVFHKSPVLFFSKSIYFFAYHLIL